MPANKNDVITFATAKIAKELEEFKGGNKEKAVSTFVAATITHFCEQCEQFAEVVLKTPRTLSDCCSEIMRGVGNSVSDIDTYRAAVKSYFPNAEVTFVMNIEIKGDMPTEEEINRKPDVDIVERSVTPVKSAQKPEKDTLQISLF